MKKIFIVCVMLSLVIFFSGCAQKAPKVAPKPATAVEKVEEQAPKMEKPVLSEEEIFQQKTIEGLNKEGNLKKINFDFDKYVVREDMKPVLQNNSGWILKHPTVELLIEGHCDERGTVEYNIALGEKRAESAKNYLTSLGVSQDKMRIVSYGKSKPLVAGVDEATWFQNRRAEFVVTKK